ncbi:hypothetical protein [Nocardioides sp. SYSU D00038]|uniref:hypothetical protein n=1 Tax=Nocardioides sp. SYSU D00038 TaxID=2812554 RepID=UPI001F082B6B|nr:hypothetical protein [Nocardioides sp. SYSU D00038]
MCAHGKKPGPALVALSSSRPASSVTGVPSGLLTALRSRSPSCPKAPVVTAPPSPEPRTVASHASSWVSSRSTRS